MFKDGSRSCVFFIPLKIIKRDGGEGDRCVYLSFFIFCVLVDFLSFCCAFPCRVYSFVDSFEYAADDYFKYYEYYEGY